MEETKAKPVTKPVLSEARLEVLRRAREKSLLKRREYAEERRNVRQSVPQTVPSSEPQSEEESPPVVVKKKSKKKKAPVVVYESSSSNEGGDSSSDDNVILVKKKKKRVSVQASPKMVKQMVVGRDDDRPPVFRTSADIHRYYTS
eukprot:6211828-Pleurochrysis_carterae.AAC.4